MRKPVLVSFVLSLLGLLQPCGAQLTVRGSDANPSTSGSETEAAGTTTDLTPATAEPLPLLPDLTLMPDQPAKEAPRLAPVSVDPIKQRIRFREVKIKALKDPAVQREKERAAQARTDAEKREALRNYYKLLYQRMVKIDNSLAAEVTQKETQALARFEQRQFVRKKGKLGEAVLDDADD